MPISASKQEEKAARDAQRQQIMDLKASVRDGPMFEDDWDPDASFPPESVDVKLLKVDGLDDESTMAVLQCWTLLQTFASILDLGPFQIDELVAGIKTGTGQLISEVFMSLIRHAVEDLEDSYTRNHSANVTWANTQYVTQQASILEEAWAWGFDNREWHFLLNPLSWPEIMRQYALAAGWGPKRTVIVPEKAEKEDIVEDQEKDDSPDQFDQPWFLNAKPGTLKRACVYLLYKAGDSGMYVSTLVSKISELDLYDISQSKNQESSVSGKYYDYSAGRPLPVQLFSFSLLPFPAGALARDICFVRLAPSLYALRNLKVLREQAKKMVAEFEGNLGKQVKPVVQVPEGEEGERENKAETLARIEKEQAEESPK